MEPEHAARGPRHGAPQDQRTSATHHTRRLYRKRIKGDNSGSRDPEEHAPDGVQGVRAVDAEDELYSRSRDDRIVRSTKHLRQTWAEQRERLQEVPATAETVERSETYFGDNSDFTRLLKGETLRVNGTFVNEMDSTVPDLCGSGWGPY